MLVSDARIIAALYAGSEMLNTAAEIGNIVATQEGQYRDIIAYHPALSKIAMISPIHVTTLQLQPGVGNLQLQEGQESLSNSASCH